MTKQKEPMTPKLLEDLRYLAVHGDEETRMKTIGIAYELGIADGRVSGAKAVGENLMAALAALKKSQP